jgi:hypothetical protein
MKFKALTTKDEYDAAQAAGLRIEYSGFKNDSIDMPPSDQDDSGGWILEPRDDFFIPGGNYRVEYVTEDTGAYEVAP